MELAASLHRMAEAESYGGLLPNLPRKAIERARGQRPGAAPGSRPAFTPPLQRDPAPVPVLLAVPHAGRVYPGEFAEIMRKSGAL